jgi:hypothetical protein
MNSLIGVATVGQVTDDPAGPNNVSKYNAVAIPACVSPEGSACGDTGGDNNGDNVLELNDVEYARCPGGLYLNFQSEGAPDLAIDGAGNIPSVVSTNLSLVPCDIDFENLQPTQTRLVVNIRDEMENRTSLSSGLPVDCFFSGSLGDPTFSGTFTLPTLFGSAILHPFPRQSPVVGVANVLRTAGDGTSDTAATNLHFCTDESDPAHCVPVNSEITLSSFH